MYAFDEEWRGALTELLNNMLIGNGEGGFDVVNRMKWQCEVRVIEQRMQQCDQTENTQNQQTNKSPALL